MVPTPGESINRPQSQRRAQPKVDRVAAAWRERAAELAEWAERHLVNDPNVFGSYIAPERRRDGGTAITRKGRLTRQILRRHFEGRTQGDLIGLPAIGRDEPTGAGEVAACWSRWMGLDIDRHDDSVDPDKTREGALALVERLDGIGFDPLVFDSNGAGGYHIVVIFDRPVPSERVHSFAKWLIRDWKKLGLPEEPETFPKQPRIEAGEVGNWLRLAGLHHSRSSWSRVWDGSTWLAGAEAIEAILGKQGDPACLIRDEYKVKPPARKPRANTPAGEQSRDLELAGKALGFLDPSMHYKDWLAVGMALSHLGRDGLDLWDDWSRGSEKWKEGACDRKFRSFRGSGVNLATLFGMAGRLGFEFPKRREPAAKPQPTPDAGLKVHRPEDGEGGGWDTGPPPQGGGDGDELPRFGNYHLARGKLDEDGNPTYKSTPHNIRQIDADRVALTEGWPRRVGERLFVSSDRLQPIYLNSAARLFSWLDARAHVDWTKGPRFVTQERYYEHLRMEAAEQFDSIEVLPHVPAIPHAFYMHPPLPAPSGRLDELLDRFLPLTPADRSLIAALIVTPLWGGEPGTRPAFLITGPDRDKEQGRGLGKTTLLDLVANVLYGGAITVSPNDDMGDVITRMLSAGGEAKRIARLDNVKSFRFSWGELEDLITARSISGHGLYVGEVSRRNGLVWVITLNGASLSKDIAKRIVTIKLARPPEVSQANEEDWLKQTVAFIEEHRWAIMADAAAILARDPGPLRPATRWSSWERGVLSKLPLAEESQAAMIERQGAVDEGNCDRDIVQDMLRVLITRGNIDPDTSALKIASQTMAEIVSQAMRTHYATNAATAFVKGLSIPELSQAKKGNNFRGWIWCGTEANPAHPQTFEPALSTVRFPK